MSKVWIANRALSYLGEKTISSFEDENEAAKAIGIHYEPSKDYLLQQHNWWFATVRANLNASSDHSDTKYPYSFEYPNDCLKVLRTDCHGEAWQRFGRQIWTTSPTFSCEYISEASEGNFSPAFESAFVFYLASMVAMTVTGDMNIKREAFSLYERTIAQAISVNDLEQGSQSGYQEQSLRKGLSLGKGRLGAY
jgi:hypothetical protein